MPNISARLAVAKDYVLPRNMRMKLKKVCLKICDLMFCIIHNDSGKLPLEGCE